MNSNPSNPSPSSFDWHAYPEIQARRSWSLERIVELTSLMSDICQTFADVRSIVVSGSLARLDGGPHSDSDVIVILSDTPDLKSSLAGDIITEISRRSEPLGLRSAQAAGIFASPTSRAELCDGPRGIVNESMSVFGKRMQLLLEARPIFGTSACRELQENILRRYSTHPFANQPHEFWSYLTDDLIRYWRSYRVWRHWDIASGNGGWHLRNLKLRYSRLLSYASLLLSCAAATQDLDSVLDLLPLTPLERLVRLNDRFDTNTIQSLCESYDRFLQIVNNSESRSKLEDIEVTQAEVAMHAAPTEFEELLVSSRSIQTALVTLLSCFPNRQAILSSLLF